MTFREARHDRRASHSPVAAGFTDSATAAMGVSAAFSVLALLLVFVLPKRVSPGR